MTDQTRRDDLVERLRRVESGSPRGEFTLNWYRNPDGPEAADRIERLEADLRAVQNAANMDKRVVVGWRARRQDWIDGVWNVMPEEPPEGDYCERQALTPHAPAQAEIDRLREELEGLNACAQEEADTLASRATDAEAIACSWKARVLAAEAEVSRLCAEREKDREALRPLARLEIPKRANGNAGAYSILHDYIRAARARLEDTHE